MRDVLYPSKVRIPRGRGPVFPALVIAQPLTTPIRDIEGRIRKNEIGLEVGVLIVVKCVPMFDLTINATDRQVHPRQTPRRVVGLLPINRNVGN